MTTKKHEEYSGTRTCSYCECEYPRSQMVTIYDGGSHITYICPKCIEEGRDKEEEEE